MRAAHTVLSAAQTCSEAEPLPLEKPIGRNLTAGAGTFLPARHQPSPAAAGRAVLVTTLINRLSPHHVHRLKLLLQSLSTSGVQMHLCFSRNKKKKKNFLFLKFLPPFFKVQVRNLPKEALRSLCCRAKRDVTTVWIEHTRLRTSA